MEETNQGPSAIITISYAGQRLLGAIDTPLEMDGAALAARQVRNCVLQAVKTYGATVPAEWGPETVRLYDVGAGANVLSFGRFQNAEGIAAALA